MSNEEEEPMDDELTALAERVCVLFGWTGVRDGSDREAALSEAWREWYAAYEARGGSVLPKKHPELSDERIKELAGRYRDRRAATLAKIDQIVVEVPRG